MVKNIQTTFSFKMTFWIIMYGEKTMMVKEATSTPLTNESGSILNVGAQLYIRERSFHENLTYYNMHVAA